MRNLPYEVTHEELVELCEPFGNVVQSKLHVGPNRNQAFVEFASLETAQGMVNYFANSPDPAKASLAARCASSCCLQYHAKTAHGSQQSATQLMHASLSEVQEHQQLLKRFPAIRRPCKAPACP